MITKFKLYENIGVSWISPDIRKMLNEYGLDVDFHNIDNCELTYDRKFSGALSKRTIDINSTDLEFFLISLDKAIIHFEIPKEKIIELKDRICEYVIKFINTPRMEPDNLQKIFSNMSDELLRKLENNPRLSKNATEELVKRSANKYNL